MTLATRRLDIAVLVVFVAALAAPLYASDFVVSYVMTRVMILGLITATLVFLSAYGGLVSLSQMFVAGTAGFAVGNIAGESGGLALGKNIWLGVIAAIVIAAVLSALLGALAARSTGIYYLMLTLTFSVIGFYFFNQVISVSGSTGLSGIDPPSILDSDTAFYLAVTITGALAYVLFRYVARTPFGLALQAVRDDPVRTASLGYNVDLIRAAAFALCGTVAAFGGIYMVWWNGQIDPRSIGLGPTIDLLIIAVIGGITTLEGAWIGAFIFVIANQYMRNLPFMGSIGLGEERFNTVVGVLVLLIMLVSPDGIAGLLGRLGGRASPSDDDPNAGRADTNLVEAEHSPSNTNTADLQGEAT